MVVRARSQTHFAILPPSRLAAPRVFSSIDADSRRHQHLLANMQRLRGRVYGADGAIRPSELTADGRHKLAVDEQSWHVLSLDEGGEVVGCLRYLEESQASGFNSLRIRHAAVARSPVEGARFRRAVEAEMLRARRLSISFVEVGGWAVDESRRWTSESLRIVLAAYALAELLGSCVGVATATFRHGSAGILQRIGLSALSADDGEIPPYHDPQYGCLMQILRFDSRLPNPRYRNLVADLMANLVDAPVICRENPTVVYEPVWRGMGAPGFAALPEPLCSGG